MQIDYPFQCESYHSVHHPDLHVSLDSITKNDAKALAVEREGMLRYRQGGEKKIFWIKDFALVRPAGSDGVSLAIQLLAKANASDLYLNGFSALQLLEFSEKTGLLSADSIIAACTSLSGKEEEDAKVTLDRDYNRVRYAYYDAEDFIPLEEKSVYRTESRHSLRRRVEKCERDGFKFRKTGAGDKDSLQDLIATHRRQIQSKEGEIWRAPNPMLFEGKPGFSNYVLEDHKGRILAWQCVFSESGFASLDGLFAGYDNMHSPGQVCLYKTIEMLFESGVRLIFQGADSPRLRFYKESMMPMRSYDSFSTQIHLGRLN